MDAEISYRSADSKDLEFMRKLRNANRQFFLTDSYITKEQQKKWWYSQLWLSGDRWYVILYGKKRAGMFGVRKHYCKEISHILQGSSLAKEDCVYEPLSVIVDEKYRGLHIMDKVYAQLFADKSKKWIGEVKWGNDRVLHVDMKAGFRPFKIILERL